MFSEMLICASEKLSFAFCAVCSNFAAMPSSILFVRMLISNIPAVIKLNDFNMVLVIAEAFMDVTASMIAKEVANNIFIVTKHVLKANVMFKKDVAKDSSIPRHEIATAAFKTAIVAMIPPVATVKNVKAFMDIKPKQESLII